MSNEQDYILLWHGTNLKNHRGILKRGFKSGSWFAIDEKTARQFGLMTCKRESSLVLMSVAVKLSDLYYNGYYCSKGVLNLHNSIYQIKNK